METVVLVATWLFVVTNVDKLVVLVAFCVDEDYRAGEVFIGLYAGFSVGLAGAALGAAAAAELLQGRTFLLGVVPLMLGIWGFVRHSPHLEGDAHADGTELHVVPGPTGRIAVVTGTIAGLNGENLAVYVPFFAGLSAPELALVLALYVVGAGAVFLVALVIARRSVAAAAAPPEWIHRWLVPTVLTLVGTYVIVAGWLVA